MGRRSSTRRTCSSRGKLAAVPVFHPARESSTMMMFRSLACLSLTALPLLAQNVFQLPAVDSVSVSQTTVYNDNRLRAYTGSGTSPLLVRGLFKFDVSAIPDNAPIVKMKLTLNMEN